MMISVRDTFLSYTLTPPILGGCNRKMHLSVHDFLEHNPLNIPQCQELFFRIWIHSIYISPVVPLVLAGWNLSRDRGRNGLRWATIAAKSERRFLLDFVAETQNTYLVEPFRSFYIGKKYLKTK